MGYISTQHNTADIFTKELARKLHRHHTGRLLAELREGKLFDVHGTRMELGDAKPVLRKLYKTVPPGLERASKNALGELNEMFDDMFKSPQATKELHEVPKLSAPALAALVLGRVKKRMRRAVARHVAATAARVVAKWAAAALSSKLALWERDTIIDSGASSTYVPRGVPLLEARPGNGHVMVADGRKVPITQRGNLGPLAGAKRVDNLKQVLVSVRDLVEQFGPVVFDEFGVYVNGTNGGADSGKGRTRIGAPTVNRLYRFDYRALCQHARARGRSASAG